jgi:hypothetical protein
MKNKLHRTLLLTAAGLALSAAGAYAQTATVTADIPFAFQTMGGQQTAGRYTLAPVDAAHSVFSMRNVETGRASLLGIGTGIDPSGARAQLVFRCAGEGGCVLASVSMGDGRAWKYQAPHRKPSEQERIAVVYLDRKQAE